MSSKYIRKTDADRIIKAGTAALAALEQELLRAIDQQIAAGVAGAQIRAQAEAEVKAVLTAIDQVEAATYAQLDAASVDGPDTDDDEAA